MGSSFPNVMIREMRPPDRWRQLFRDLSHLLPDGARNHLCRSVSILLVDQHHGGHPVWLPANLPLKITPLPLPEPALAQRDLIPAPLERRCLPLSDHLHRFIQGSSDRKTDGHPELPFVDVGKEVSSNQGNNKEGPGKNANDPRMTVFR